MADQPRDPFRLDGSKVLVTGAGGGIGHALVDAFGSAGASVCAADRDMTLMDGLDVSQRLVFDLADEEGAAREIGRLVATGWLPDILVNNAGFTRGETIPTVDTAAWEAEVEVNLNGAFYVTAPLAAIMAERGAGSIVFVSSVNGIAHFGNPAYSAAKAGLIAYARALAVELGEKGVRANVVCPGSVRTHAWDHRLERDPAILADVIRHYPLGRLVVPDEVARAVLFLASPAASGITGAVLPVDAGLTAGNLRFVREVIERRS